MQVQDMDAFIPDDLVIMFGRSILPFQRLLRTFNHLAPVIFWSNHSSDGMGTICCGIHLY